MHIPRDAFIIIIFCDLKSCKYIVINIEYCYVITDKLYDLNRDLCNYNCNK